MNYVALGFGGPYDIVIIAVVVLLLFGGARLAGFGKSAGQAIRGFKEEVTRSDDSSSEKARSDDTKS